MTPQLRVPGGADALRLVAAAVLELAEEAGLSTRREKRVADALRRVESVAAGGISVRFGAVGDGPEPWKALSDLLLEVGAAATEQGRVALVHVDEVQNVTDEAALSQLLVALGDAITHETTLVLPGGARVSRSLPLAVYLTGLPDFEDRAGAQKGATFARRFRTTVLTALDDDDVRAALQDFVVPGWEVPGRDGDVGRVRMTAEAANAIVEICRGEPFLFQLAGERAWYAGSGDTVTRDDVLVGWRGAHREATAHVERILARLPERERSFLDAMARTEPAERRLLRLAVESGFASSSAAATTAQRLDTVRGIIARGPLYTFRHRAIEAYLTSEWPTVR